MRLTWHHRLLPSIRPRFPSAQRVGTATCPSCVCTELRLYCELDPPEQDLHDLPRLSDPEQARALLEGSIRTGSTDYREIRIQACRPQVLNYKPGSRCTIRYDLEYAQTDVGRGWPDSVIAKTYDDDTGEQAYEGMAALWRSPLATGEVVRIAEPYAYVPGLNLLIQAPLQEEQTLEQLLRSLGVHGVMVIRRQTSV